MVLHEVDPNGDTILTLHNPGAPFAVWDGRKEPKRALTQPPPPFPIQSEKSQEQSLAPQDNPNEQENEKSASNTPVAPDGEPVLAQFRLSSKHLVLSSGYFKRMMTGPWKEAVRDSESNFAVDASDWDETAFLALMNIIHGRTRDVPPKVDIAFASRIAVMTDYYQCHQVVELWFENIWKKQIDSWTSCKYWDTLILNLFTSWVFPDPSIFSNMTLTASKLSLGPIQTMGLPIPEDIISIIIRTFILRLYR